MPKGYITDQPCVTYKEAAAILNQGELTFKRRFKDDLHKQIDSVKTKNGVKMLLVDVLKVAFPGASKVIIYTLALNYVMQAYDRRVKTRHAITRGKQDAEPT